MFPRVLGYLAGRAVAETYRFFSNPENRERAAMAAIETAAFVVLPPATRPLAAAYRVWNLFYPRQELPLQNPRPQSHSGSSSQQRTSLECYLGAIQASDPWLVSPVGTMPLESCLGR